MLEITTKANELVKKFNMLSQNDFVVVCVSGGADSMCLLDYLLSVKNEYNLKLLVANVEHGIRGQESVDDTKFVEEYCKEKNIDFKSISIDAVNGAKEQGMSVEEYSREARYSFFRSFNPDKIATAHNLSDNVETVLFRLSRGTSIKGMCGIPAVRGNIIRPLLNCSGTEIREYCNKNNIPYRIDSTNANNEYSRNQIRNEIIPQFEKLNSSFENNVSRFINSVQEDEECLTQLANKCVDECFKKDALLISKMLTYPVSIQKRAIIKFYDMYGLSLDELHLNKIVELLHKSGRVQISKNYFAISDKKRLRMAIFEENIDFDELIVKKKIISRQEFLNNYELLKKEFDFYCDYDKINGNMIFRQRESGDEISPAGRDCTKSLKKLYNEYHIDVEKRDNIPVICDDEDIIGVYGYCCSEKVKIDNTTSSVILIKIYSEE